MSAGGRRNDGPATPLASEIPGVYVLQLLYDVECRFHQLRVFPTGGMDPVGVGTPRVSTTVLFPILHGGKSPRHKDQDKKRKEKRRPMGGFDCCCGLIPQVALSIAAMRVEWIDCDNTRMIS